MSRITVQSLTKTFNGEDLFSDISFEALPGMRLAVTGPNGCGKSTLLRILAGRLEHDGGSISVSKGARLGYVAQELAETELEDSLISWVLAALPSWGEFWKEWEEAAHNKDEAHLLRLSSKQAEFEAAYGYNPDHQARAILSGLGFTEDSFFKPLRLLSGGWRERAKLARVLLQGADILLLDEPTNHLDIEAVEWLEQYLLNFRGTLIVVVHDRVFLNRVGTHVLHLGSDKCVLRRGTFEEYLAWEEETARQREKEAEKLSARIDHEQDYIRRFRVKARKAAQAQSKMKKVEKMQEELAKISGSGSRRVRTLSFRLPAAPRGDKVAVGAQDLEFHYKEGHSVWNGLNFQLYRGKKIALAAPNGAGKSTLIKLITGELQSTRGSITVGSNTSIGYCSQHQSDILRMDGTALDEMRRLSDPDFTEEQLKSALGLFMLGQGYFDRPVTALSGGEKNRLLLASLFMKGVNLLILDEPTNHLDLESREGLIGALQQFDGTLFFVAHDRYLLREVADEIWLLGEDGIEVYLGGFAEYEEKRKALAKEEKRQPKSGPEASVDKEKAPESRRMTREEKRRAAEVRNEIYREMKPLQKEYDTLEEELERLSDEIASVEELMQSPETFSSAENAREINEKYTALSGRSEDVMDRMGQLEEHIAELTEKREALLTMEG